MDRRAPSSLLQGRAHRATRGGTDLGLPLASPPPGELDPGHHPLDGAYGRLHPSGTDARPGPAGAAHRAVAGQHRPAAGGVRGRAVLRRRSLVELDAGSSDRRRGADAPHGALWGGGDERGDGSPPSRHGIMIGHARLRRWLALAALSAAAACGGGDDGTGPTQPPPSDFSLRTVGGGNNVPDRFSSDLWVYGNHVYTGTWGHGTRNGNVGDLVYIWSLDAGGAPTRVGSVGMSGINTVSDVEVSSDGAVLLFSGEGGPNGGIYLYDLTDPVHPAFLDSALANGGVHTATFGEIGGRRDVFSPRDGPPPPPLVYHLTHPPPHH